MQNFLLPADRNVEAVATPGNPSVSEPRDPQMKQFDITEAQAAFAEIVELAARGEETLIIQNGKPLVRVLPFRKSRIGLLTEVYPPVPDDIDTPFAKDIEEMFYGKDE